MSDHYIPTTIIVLIGLLIALFTMSMQNNDIQRLTLEIEECNILLDNK